MNRLEEENIIADVASRSFGLRQRMEKIAAETDALINIRNIGFLTAADIVDPAIGKPFPSANRTGYQCYKKALESGALLRPLGDTLYILPPLNTPDETLDELTEIAVKAIKEVVVSS